MTSLASFRMCLQKVIVGFAFSVQQWGEQGSEAEESFSADMSTI